MEKNINGLHHITVLASNPQQNYDFYTKVMGLRFIKKTVNFDAPDVYHFYFGDETGTPGSILTFFPFPNASKGKRGNGEATTVSFSIPVDSMDFWIQHLSRLDIKFSGPYKKFHSNVISLHDPDGMAIELVEDKVAHLKGWETAYVSRKFSIRKFFGIRVLLKDATETKKMITELFGFKPESEDKNIRRFVSGEDDHRVYFDLEVDPDGRPALQSAGSIHHIAWRTESDDTQQKWINRLRREGYLTTDMIDRNYFHSIYFREPGGVLFEIATDGPGFLIDEEIDALGEALKLPPKYESKRANIEKMLIPITQPVRVAS
jgi:glyoxalase family protein